MIWLPEPVTSTAKLRLRRSKMTGGGNVALLKLPRGFPWSQKNARCGKSKLTMNTRVTLGRKTPGMTLAERSINRTVPSSELKKVDQSRD